MMSLLSLWWAWIAIAIALGIVEVMVPGFIFLGFALGALIMTGIVALFPGLSAAALFALFAGLSLLCWVALRLMFKRQSSGAQVFTDDINDG
jgi:membrane protein implicated in regulation of membrane protease activity